MEILKTRLTRAVLFFQVIFHLCECFNRLQFKRNSGCRSFKEEKNVFFLVFFKDRLFHLPKIEVVFHIAIPAKNQLPRIVDT
jgi:hypothetical protein